MTRAYQEIYLSKAQSVIGDAFDYAVNTCGIIGTDFVKLFIASSVSKRMENGEPAYLAGKSGIEIVREIVAETKGQELQIEPQEHFGRSKEYWIGWAIAYYQWYSGRKYSDIFKVLSFEDLQMMYYTLHEADITKFVTSVDYIIDSYYEQTALTRMRNNMGISQLELANRSGVNVRVIQSYEQKIRNINKAQLSTVANLAKALDCSPLDLMEQ